MLTRRALNRATLARQLLLDRSDISAVSAVARIAGMQMQDEAPVFVGLWARLSGVTRAAVMAAFADRSLVRATAMRGTLYAMTAEELAWVHPTIGPELARGAVAYVKRLASPGEIAAAIDLLRPMLRSAPLTAEEMRDAIAATSPAGDVRKIAYAARMSLPLIQVPGGGSWGFASKTPFALAESWIGAPLATSPDAPRLVRRYLAAYGPATAADVGVWTGLPGTTALLKAMEGELRTFRGEGKAILYDVPDGPLPDEATPAPPRLLPAFDNLLLGHKDRTRVVSDEHRARLYQAGNLRILPSFLVDGEVAGTWRIETTRRQATLSISPFVPLSDPDRLTLTQEAESLAPLIDPTATSHIVLFDG